MFKHLLTTGFLAVSLITAAQTIPNPGLENWSDTGLGYDDPDDWITGNILSLFGAPISVTESAASHSGTAAARCETLDFDGDPFPGVLALQLPTTGRPDSLISWINYVPTGSDECRITVLLSKWDGSDAVTIGEGSYTTVITNGYIRVAVGIDYLSTDAPDSLKIGYTSSADTPELNSVLFVDDVSLVTNPTTGIVETKQVPLLNVYPNPARETLNIAVAKDATIEIYNALGMLVETVRANPSKAFVLSTSDYRNGVYLARSSSGVTQRFVVKH